MHRLFERLTRAYPWLGWLRLGMGMKRWVVLLLSGIVALGLGIAFVLVEIYQGGQLPLALEALTLQFLPRWVRALILGIVGLGSIGFALAQLSSTLLAPFSGRRPIVEVVAEHRRKQRGPRVVVIGGGTGMSTLLRGLKKHTSNITAIVTVADDGGSSGRLRRSLGVLPPGDFRNCLAALADDESLITQLFQYRFGAGEGLEGHSFGNLFLTAMSEVTGSFEKALLESSRVLTIQGRVVPSTLQDVTLVADLRPEDAASAYRVTGESAIPVAPGAIERVFLQPDDAPAFPDAVQALLAADLIVAGPGSLYTSVIPNLLVRDIAAAVRVSRAIKAYVCNVATQPGETDHYGVLDHVKALEAHANGVFEIVVANDKHTGKLLPKLDWVRPGPSLNGGHRLVAADLIDDDKPWRHDSVKLAAVLMKLLEEDLVMVRK
ncbi:MAG TPA: uridine diphosphate-N-acetylglucosamine-binding protein YvcK [Anaerolineales bacterium]|nr:uridine diphosphate-N-acetylglucosamine-binding protein YvcK [Anaerolineales bacterium]